MAAWEPARAQEWLEVSVILIKKKVLLIIFNNGLINKFVITYQRLNSTEFFVDIVVQHEYVECIASSIEVLVLFKKLYLEHRKEEIENFIGKAVAF